MSLQLEEHRHRLQPSSVSACRKRAHPDNNDNARPMQQKMARQNVAAHKNKPPRNYIERAVQAFSFQYKIGVSIARGVHWESFAAMPIVGEARKIGIKIVKPRAEDQVNLFMPKEVLREVKLLKEMSHPNIISLENVLMVSQEAAGNEDSHGNLTVAQLKTERVAPKAKVYVGLVFEFVDQDLDQFISAYYPSVRQSNTMPAQMIKSIAEQIMSALCYLHTNWVVHRDICPRNIFIERASGKIKIANFDRARIFKMPAKPPHQIDPLVADRCYRSPELLLGSRSHYHHPCIDMWSAGCVIAKLITGVSLFEEECKRRDSINPFSQAFTGTTNDATLLTMCDVSMCQSIFLVMGFPTKETHPSLVHLSHYSKLATWNKANPGSYPKTSMLRSKLGFAQLFLNFSLADSNSDEYDNQRQLALLVENLLEMDPLQRVSAQASLGYPYFSG